MTAGLDHLDCPKTEVRLGVLVTAVTAQNIS